MIEIVLGDVAIEEIADPAKIAKKIQDAKTVALIKWMAEMEDEGRFYPR